MRGSLFMQMKAFGRVRIAAAALLAALPPLSCVTQASGGADIHSGSFAAISVAAVPGTDARSTEAGPLRIGVLDAVVLAVENHPSLTVARSTPEIRKTFEEAVKAAYDPIFGGSASFNRSGTERNSSTGIQRSTSGGFAWDNWASFRFPTGTSATLSGRSDLAVSSLYADAFSTSRLGLTVTQSLLQGAGIGPNLASLDQARLETAASQYEIRALAEALVAQAEDSYWDLALARMQVDIFRESLGVAEQQLAETAQSIEVGRTAQTELAAARAQVAGRLEELINARSAAETARLRLLRALGAPGRDGFDREVELLDAPFPARTRLEPVDRRVLAAMRMRPDLNQSRLLARQGDLELVRTRNGLLPKLDFFFTLGVTGAATAFPDSMGGLDHGNVDVSAGLSVEIPAGNRAQRASHRRAQLRADQLRDAIRNLEQAAVLEVRTAFVEVSRARESVSASRATRELRTETLRAEIEKFRVGKSTSYWVAAAERDLTASRLAEARAAVSTLKSLVALYRAEGTLLLRRGIRAPGAQPADYPPGG